jgi:hypothetical protein
MLDSNPPCLLMFAWLVGIRTYIRVSSCQLLLSTLVVRDCLLLAVLCCWITATDVVPEPSLLQFHVACLCTLSGSDRVAND